MSEPVTRQDLKDTENRIVNLLTEFKESFESEMHGVRDRLTAQSVRLDRQGALIQTGSRWTNRINGWTEGVDRLLEKQAADIADLEKRP